GSSLVATVGADIGTLTDALEIEVDTLTILLTDATADSVVHVADSSGLTLASLDQQTSGAAWATIVAAGDLAIGTATTSGTLILAATAGDITEGTLVAAYTDLAASGGIGTDARLSIATAGFEADAAGGP